MAHVNTADARDSTWVRITLGVLAAQFLALGAIEAWRDSYTVDEPIYMVSGTLAWTEHDLRLNVEHPPLPKMLAAIPALLAWKPDIPRDWEGWDQAWASGDTNAIAMATVAANQDDIQKVAFLYRIVPLLEGAAIGLLLYLVGRDLLGVRAGLLAAFLWLTSPVAVAFSHLLSLDIPAALVGLLVAWSLLKYSNNPSWWRWAAVAGLAGAALLTRAAAGLVLVAVASLTVAIFGFSKLRFRAILAGFGVAVVAWAMVWGAYAVLDRPAAPRHSLYWVMALEPEGLSAKAALVVPWPEAYEAGIRFLADYHSTPGPGYLMGASFSGTPWWYWFGTLAVKLTPVVLATLVLGLFGWKSAGRGRGPKSWVLLGLPLVGLTAMMSQAQRPFGVRYLLVLVVFLLLLAAPAAYLVRRRWTLYVAGALMAAQLAMLWMSFPHSLAWVNPGFGEGWRVVSDSSLDWGQDFYRLEDWAEDKEAPYIAYFGNGPSWTLDEIPNAVSAHPYSASGPWTPIPASTEWVVVSASHLNRPRSDDVEWLRDWCPVDIIGKTILVYRFEEVSPSRVLIRENPGMPAGLCRDSEYSIKVR